MTEPIKTPCKKVCMVDGMTGHCFGCGRKLKEIAGWAQMTPAERDAIMAELPGRMMEIERRRETA